jgi:hypothetical protein
MDIKCIGSEWVGGMKRGEEKLRREQGRTVFCCPRRFLPTLAHLGQDDISSLLAWEQ